MNPIKILLPFHSTGADLSGIFTFILNSVYLLVLGTALMLLYYLLSKKSKLRPIAWGLLIGLDAVIFILAGFIFCTGVFPAFIREHCLIF